MMDIQRLNTLSFKDMRSFMVPTVDPLPPLWDPLPPAGSSTAGWDPLPPVWDPLPPVWDQFNLQPLKHRSPGRNKFYLANPSLSLSLGGTLLQNIAILHAHSKL